VYKYGVFNYLDYFNLLNRFKIDEYKSYQLRIIKRRSYIVNRDYHIDNKLHRDYDRPVVEWPDGTKWWHQNGKLHRDNDKPAIEWGRWYKRMVVKWRTT
jgi:hypothetical protein